jgi:hypothetical protein
MKITVEYLKEWLWWMGLLNDDESVTGICSSSFLLLLCDAASITDIL